VAAEVEMGVETVAVRCRMILRTVTMAVTVAWGKQIVIIAMMAVTVVMMVLATVTMTVVVVTVVAMKMYVHGLPHQ